MSLLRLFVSCLAAALTIPLTAYAAPAGTSDTVRDWPQIRGPERDGRSSETGLLKSWLEDGPHRVWHRSIGQGFSSVSVAAGRLYTMDADAETEYALALDPETGEEVWRTAVGALFTNQFGDGPRSTPTVEGDTVYVFSSRGQVAALAARDGRSKWTVELTETYGSEVPRFGYSASVLVEDDLLLIEAGGTDGHALVALDKASGKKRWSALDGPAAYSSPIVADFGGVRQIVFFRRSEPQIVSLLPSGEVYWTYEGLSTVIHMPLLVPPDGVFISSTHDAIGFLLRVGVEDGMPRVEEAWRTPKLKNHFNTSVVVDGHIYGFDNAIFKSFDAEAGTQNWAARGLGKGSLIEADGQLIVLSDSGLVALVEANPEEYRERGRFQGLTGKAWTPPTLAGGRLYLRDQDEIASYDLKTPSAVSTGAASRTAGAERPAALSRPRDDAELTVDAVLARYAEARGSAERWRRVEALEAHGAFTSYSIREDFSLLRKRGGLYRFETVINGGPTVHGSDRAGPWWIEPMLGVPSARRPPAPLARQVARDAELEPALLDAVNKGHRVELAGRGEVNGQETLKLDVTLASGARETWHLDPATFLEVAVDSKSLDFSQSGEPLDMRAYLTDFRQVRGLMIPHRVERECLSRHTVLEIEKLEIDPELGDGRFSLPLSEAMEALRPLAGEWDLRIETRANEEQPWQPTITTSTITPLLDGALLEERFRFDHRSGPVNVVRQRTWDSSREVYRFTQADDSAPFLIVFEGHLEDGRLTATNQSTGTALRFDEIEVWERQTSYDISPEGFRIDWERSTDGGKTWLTTTRYTYSKPEER